jgi:hypothetical protein
MVTHPDHDADEVLRQVVVLELHGHPAACSTSVGLSGDRLAFSGMLGMVSM